MPADREPDGRMVEGVLIEGVDFIGKTTVARRLVDCLSTDGHPAEMRQCYMSGSPLVRFLDEQAKAYDSMLERDSYYSAAILLDLLLSRPVDAFLVQDRHWLSQVGRNLFFHPDRELIPAGLLESLHRPFRSNVLLTSALEAKLERSDGREVKSPRDRYLRENPAAHQQYEEFLERILPKDEPWVVLDTTGQTVDDVVASVRAQLGGRLARVG